MKQRSFLCRLVLLGAAIIISIPMAFSEELPPLPKAPLYLTSVQAKHLNADYWINRLKNPDAVIKDAEQIKVFNQDVKLMFGDMKEIFKMEERRRGKDIRDQIELEYKAVKNRLLFDKDNQTIPKSFFETEIKPLVQTDKIPDRIPMKWGAATQSTSVRALPTDVLMIEERDDVEFDQLQFTRIKVWTPVGVYHTSSDGKWMYIQAPYSRGWVKARDIALFDSREELRKLVEREKDFLIVTAPSVPLFSDPSLSEVRQYPSMGAKFPILDKTLSYYKTVVPARGERGEVQLWTSYISRKSDVSEGRLAYTQRNVINQAFKLLGARYGWGGMYKGRDCSGFVFDVFMSLGIEIPRNSKPQGFIGTQLGHFTPFEDYQGKIDALNAGLEGITFIRMPKHMMLYLGQENGLHYIIHSTWAERIGEDPDKDEKNRINQVVVSDLTLNGNSYLGSLFQRIISINEVN